MMLKLNNMSQKLILTLLLLAILPQQLVEKVSVVAINAYASSSALTLFNTEQAAKDHCPSDIVVWLNLPSGIYHYKGQRWYGNTKHGAYVCEEEADDVGDRSTHNGQ